MEKENNIPTAENLENTIPTEIDEVSTEQEKAVHTERRCMNCQALLEEGQMFCPECGASQKKVCPQCGAEIRDDQAFCPSCGQKVTNITGDNSQNAINQFNDNLEKQRNKKKAIPIVVSILAVCAVIIYLLISVFLNPQHYIEKANYQTAYKVANSSAKEDILRENTIAVVSADCIDSLKDSSSFELRDAWIQIKEDSRIIILKVAANNSYGNQVINYWYYSYDKDDKEYSLYTTFSDFNEEKTYSWDDSNEKLEKLLKNLAKTTAQNVMKDGVNIKKNSINTINELFENDLLDDVTLLDNEPQKTE